MILSFWACIDLLFCNMNVDLSLSGFFVDSGGRTFGGNTPEVILCPFLKNGWFGCAGFLLWHEGSLVATRKLLAVVHGISFPDQGWDPGPLHWECGILATGPPGKP